MYYLFLFVLLSLSAFFDVIKVDKMVKLFFVILSAFLLFSTSSLKYETGVDWYDYNVWLKEIDPIDKLTNSNNNILDGLNLGYNIIMSIVKYFNGSMQVVYFFAALTSACLLVNSLYRYTNFQCIGILLYYALLFFFLDMSGIRQGIALGIFFYSIKFIYEKRCIKYVLYILLATLIHWSAFFLILVYFLANIEFKSWVLGIFFFTGFFIFILNFHWLEGVILSFFPYLENELLAAKLVVYTTNSSLAVERTLGPFTILNIFFCTIIFFVSILNRKSLSKEYPYFNIFLNIFMLQIFAFFYLFEFLDLSERLKFYFLVSNLVLLPYFISLVSSNLSRYLVYFGIVLYALIGGRTYIFEADYTIAYHPYQNILIHKIFQIKSTGFNRLILQEKIDGQ